MLLLPNINPTDVQAWAERLAKMEAADDFDGRDYYIDQARWHIELQRSMGLIPDTPDNAPTEASPAPSDLDMA